MTGRAIRAYSPDMARWICEYCTSTGEVPEGESAEQMSCPNCGEPVMQEW